MRSSTKPSSRITLVELIFLRPFIEENERLAQWLCYLALISAPALLWVVRHIHSTALSGPVMILAFLVIFLGGGVVKWGTKSERDMIPTIAAALTALVGWCVFVYLLMSYVTQAFHFSWTV
jgi:lipopolysaccharide export LptBFGC system permease protein LptF